MGRVKLNVLDASVFVRPDKNIIMHDIFNTLYCEQERKVKDALGLIVNSIGGDVELLSGVTF